MIVEESNVNTSGSAGPGRLAAIGTMLIRSCFQQGSAKRFLTLVEAECHQAQALTVQVTRVRRVRQTLRLTATSIGPEPMAAACQALILTSVFVLACNSGGSDWKLSV